MKKMFVIIVCLTVIISVNAQNYDKIIVTAYRNWVVYNDGKTIEDFIREKWCDVYMRHVSSYGRTAEKGSRANKIYENNLKKHKESLEIYINNPTVGDKFGGVIYGEANHSQEYGHFEGNCLHEKGCSHKSLFLMYETKYDRALEQYESFYHNCLICKYEKTLVDDKQYDKILKKRYENWVKSDKYKLLKGNKKRSEIEHNKAENEKKKKNKKNFDKIMNRL